MFELTVETTFSAAHAIVLRGERETVHGHDWRVRVTVSGEALDHDGLLCDFHALEASLEAVVGPFRNRDLNATPPFDRENPTAEHVARHVGTALSAHLAPGVRITRVDVTEAPGCVASWLPDE